MHKLSFCHLFADSKLTTVRHNGTDHYNCRNFTDVTELVKTLMDMTSNAVQPW